MRLYIQGIIQFIRKQLYKKIDHPLWYQFDNLTKIVIVQFILVFFFLFLFKPFNVNEAEQKLNYFIICCLHSLAPALIVYFYFRALNFFRKKYPQYKTVLFFREFLHVAIVFLLVGLSSFLMRGLIYTNPNNWSLHYLWEELRNGYLAGSLFYFYLIFAIFYFRSKRFKTSTDGDLKGIGEPTVIKIIPPEIFIKAYVKMDDFSFNPDHFLFAKAEGNYVEFMIRKDGSLKKELKRISLTRLEPQLAGYSWLFRCHRAYLINLSQIIKTSGNSQGYWVSFNGTDEKVPVSRAQLSSFNHLFDQFRT